VFSHAKVTNTMVECSGWFSKSC